MTASQSHSRLRTPQHGRVNLLRRLLPVFVCLALLIFAGCGSDEQRTTAGLGSGQLKWSSLPVSLRADSALHDGGPADEDLLAAVAFWETKAGKNLFTIGTWPNGQAPYTGASSDPDDLLDNAIFFLSPWPFDGRIAGKTTIHSTNSAIQKAVIFLNSDTALCAGNCAESGDDLRTSRRRLLAHEMGHFLGFAHVNDRENIMYPEIVPGGSLDDRSVDLPLLQKLTSP